MYAAVLPIPGLKDCHEIREYPGTFLDVFITEPEIHILHFCQMGYTHVDEISLELAIETWMAFDRNVPMSIRCIVAGQ